MGLNATVTPGLTVTSSTVLSAANLNLLGTPTVSITGSIDTSDIGDDTIGSNQIVDGAVNQDKIGNIGGANYILSGNSSGVGTGLNTLANDGSTDKISLLVNDTSTLKPRYITGHLDVSAATSSSDGDVKALNLTIKDNTISQSMLQTNAVQAHIGNIQPGGGLTANGGVASKTNGEGGGIIFFDPTADAPIGTTNYFGKAKVLPVPTVANQYLKSTASGAVAFGLVGGIPNAFVNAYSPVYRGSTEASSGDIFTKLFGTGVYGIKREHSLTGAEAYGVLLVVFEAGIFDENDNVGVMGSGINSDYEYAGLMPFVHSQVAVARFDESLSIVTDTTVDERPYVYVKWLMSTRSSGTIGVNGVLAPQDSLQDGSGLYFRGVNACNMSFYKY